MKNIVIIGGGISGLALLHNLKVKFSDRPDVKIVLLEKSERLGGTASSQIFSGGIFEQGPNGFLDSKEETLRLCEELGLKDQLVRAQASSDKKYLLIDGRLEQFPTDLSSFFKFHPLNFWDKAKLPFEIFVRKGINPAETVYEFGVRRFGEKFTNLFLDPFVTGIYGGDVKELNLKAAFPRIYELEQSYGSLFLAMFKLKKARKTGEKASLAMPKGTLTSFAGGMSQLSEAIAKRYLDSIYLKHEVHPLETSGGNYFVNAGNASFRADKIYMCVPAFVAGGLVRNIAPTLSDLLAQISYAPMAVCGLLYERADFRQTPEGFGYLVPSYEQKGVLGVVFDSHIFPNRAAVGKVFVRLMLGGVHSPDIVKNDRTEILRMAKEELRKRFQLEAEPKEEFCITYPKAIPQYNRAYASILPLIEKELVVLKDLQLVSNYWKGVAFNDCVLNAKKAALGCML